MNRLMCVFFFLYVLFFTKVCLFVCCFLIGGACWQQDGHQSLEVFLIRIQKLFISLSRRFFVQIAQLSRQQPLG